jgi:hypothetical protein
MSAAVDISSNLLDVRYKFLSTVTAFLNTPTLNATFDVFKFHPIMHHDSEWQSVVRTLYVDILDTTRMLY